MGHYHDNKGGSVQSLSFKQSKQLVVRIQTFDIFDNT